MAELLDLLTLSPSWHWLAYTVAALVQCALLLAVALCFGGRVHLAGAEGLGADPGPAGPDAGGRAVRLAATAGRRHEAALQGRHHPRRGRPAAVPHGARTSASAPRSACSWPCRSPTAGWPCSSTSAAFFVLAVAGLEVFGVILGGYASGSKWSLYGAMREAAQVVSYEIPLALCVVVPVLICRHDGPGRDRQRARPAGSTNWHLFHDPFTFVTFWIYVTCAMASTNRAPFDLPEAESELVAGFLTEYSGFRWVDLLHGRVRGDVRRQRAGGRCCSWAAGTARCRSPRWLGLTPRHGTPCSAGSATCWACATSSSRPWSA